MRTTVIMVILAMAWAGTGTSAWSVEDLTKELAKRDAEVAKAQQAFDAALAAANERTLKVIVRIAQREAKAGNVPAAAAAWKEALRLDRKQAEATAYFTSAGNLDAVLAELDAPETDLLGNPVAGSAPAASGTPAGGKRAILIIGVDGALVPTGTTTLTEAFPVRTTELVVGKVTGDGALFEEGGSVNGQAIGVVGNEVHYVVRASGMPATITAPFDRAVAWTQISVQFNGGELRLWLNGKLAAKGTAGFTAIPGHGGGGVGSGDGNGSNCAGWARGCQFQLASFRLSNVARYTDQAGPNGKMDADKVTTLAITPEVIAAEIPAPAASTRNKTPVIATVTKLDRLPPSSFGWTATGEVGAR